MNKYQFSTVFAVMVLAMASFVFISGMDVNDAEVGDNDVAKIGETGYATLEAAILAGDDQTVELIANYETVGDLTIPSRVTLIIGENITLDVHGTLTINGSITYDGEITYGINASDAVRVYASIEAYTEDTELTGGVTKSLWEAVTNQTDGEVWVFKEGNYNTTYVSEGRNYGSIMVIKNNITLIGAVNDGEPATIFYSDYTINSSSNKNTPRTGNEQFAFVGGDGHDVILKNIQIMPMIYSVGKYHGEFEGYVPNETGNWYTPNCAITSTVEHLTLENVWIVPNTLGQKDAGLDADVYMMDDAGNFQTYPNYIGAGAVTDTQYVTLTDVVSYGGFGFDKVTTHVTMTNVTVNLGVDYDNDGKSYCGDERTMKYKKSGNPVTFGTENDVSNVVFNLYGVDACRSSALKEIQERLLSGENLDLPAGVTINVYEDIELTTNITIPEGVVLNLINGTTFTVGDDLVLTINGTVNVLGDIVIDGLVTGDGKLVIGNGASFDIASTNGIMNSTLATIEVIAGATVNDDLISPTQGMIVLTAGKLIMDLIVEDELPIATAYTLTSNGNVSGAAKITADADWFKAKDILTVDADSVLEVVSLTIPDGAKLNVIGNITGDGKLVIGNGAAFDIASTNGIMNSTLATIEVIAGAVVNTNLINPTNGMVVLSAGKLIMNLIEDNNEPVATNYKLINDGMATINAPEGWFKAKDVLTVDAGSTLVIVSLGIPANAILNINSGADVYVPTDCNLTVSNGGRINLEGILAIDGTFTNDGVIYGVAAKVYNDESTVYVSDIETSGEIPSAGYTVMLYKNITLTKTFVIPVGKSLIINLNGYKISAKDITAFNVKDDLTITGGGAIEVLKQNVNVTSIKVEAGKLSFSRDVTVTINKLEVSDGASINGKICFGDMDNFATMNDIEVGSGGIVMTKGSIKMSGNITDGKIVIDGNAVIDGSLTLTNTVLEIAPGASLSIPEGMVLTVNDSGENADMIVNGKVYINGMANVAVMDATNGKVEVFNRLTVTESSIGNRNVNSYPGSTVSGLVAKEVPIAIFYSGPTVIELKTNNTNVQIGMFVAPSNANIIISPINGNQYLTYDRVSNTINGALPAQEGRYTATITASYAVVENGNVHTYTSDPITITFNVTQEAPAESDEPADPQGLDLSTSDIAKIILIIIIAVLLIVVAAKFILKI